MYLNKAAVANWSVVRAAAVPAALQSAAMLRQGLVRASWLVEARGSVLGAAQQACSASTQGSGDADGPSSSRPACQPAYASLISPCSAGFFQRAGTGRGGAFGTDSQSVRHLSLWPFKQRSAAPAADTTQALWVSSRIDSCTAWCNALPPPDPPCPCGATTTPPPPLPAASQRARG